MWIIKIGPRGYYNKDMINFVGIRNGFGNV